MDSGWAVRRGSRAAITGHSRGHAPLERDSGGVLGLSCPPLPRVQEHAQTVRGGPQRYCVPTGVPGKQVASGGHSPESREERPPPAEGDSPGLTITPKCHGQHVPRVPLVLTCPSLSLLWGPGSPESVQPTGSTRVFSRRDPTNQSPLNDGPRSTMPVSAPSPPGPGTAGVLSDPLRRASRVCAPAYSGRPSPMAASSLLILLQEKLQAWAPICGRTGCASPWALMTAPVCGRAGCASPWALMLPWLCLVKNLAPVTLEPVAPPTITGPPSAPYLDHPGPPKAARRPSGSHFRHPSPLTPGGVPKAPAARLCPLTVLCCCLNTHPRPGQLSPPLSLQPVSLVPSAHRSVLCALWPGVSRPTLWASTSPPVKWGE